MCKTELAPELDYDVDGDEDSGECKEKQEGGQSVDQAFLEPQLLRICDVCTEEVVGRQHCCVKIDGQRLVCVQRSTVCK